MAKLSKIKIKNAVVKYLTDVLKLTIKSEESDTGYFLFNFGKNSVFRFTFKEIKGWKFGLWINFTDKTKKEYEVEFFGDRIDWINKFKPTQTPLANRVVVSSVKDIEDNFSKIYELFEYHTDEDNYDAIGKVLGDWMRSLKYNRRMTEYFLYDHGNKSFIKYLWDDFWYYKIKKLLTNWYEDHFLGVILRVLSKYIGFKYRKYIKVRPVIDQHKEYFFPKWEVGVEYLDECDEMNARQVYKELEESRVVKFINNQNANFIQYWDSNDRRGFYFTKEELDEVNEYLSVSK